MQLIKQAVQARARASERESESVRIETEVGVRLLRRVCH